MGQQCRLGSLWYCRILYHMIIIQYIASVSKDNCIKIWSTVDWTCSRSIDKLQSDKFGSGLYKTARWAPDGSMLCVTHTIYVLSIIL